MARRVLDPADLPPRPDPWTGLPHPPHAPDPGSENEGVVDLAAVPQPPAGEGPVLAHYRPILRSRTKFWLLVRGIAAVLVPPVLYVLIPGMSVWILVWLLLVTLMLLGTTVLLIRSSGRSVSSAGAEWYSTGQRWVRTYELVQVTMSQGRGRDANLRLVDVHGHELQVSYAYLRRNRLIWDLVYNGILHSVIAGNARTNMSSRVKLDLPDATP